MRLLVLPPGVRVVFLCRHLELRFVGVYGVICRDCPARWCATTPYGR